MLGVNAFCQTASKDVVLVVVDVSFLPHRYCFQKRSTSQFNLVHCAARPDHDLPVQLYTSKAMMSPTYLVQIFAVRASHSQSPTCPFLSYSTGTVPALSGFDHPPAHARVNLADRLPTSGALTRNGYLNVLAFQLRHCAANNIYDEAKITERASAFRYDSPISAQSQSNTLRMPDLASALGTVTMRRSARNMWYKGD